MLIMLMMTIVKKHNDQFSSCLFPLLSLSLLHSILFYSRRSDAIKKKERRTFYCSFLFVSFSYFHSFTPLFSSSYCWIFKSFFIALTIAHAHIRLQTQYAKANNDQVKRMHSLYNVIISVD